MRVNCQSRYTGQLVEGQAIFRTPFLVPSLTRVSSAVPKEGCSVTWNAAGLHCYPRYNEERPSVPGHLRAGLELQLPVVTATCCVAPVATGLFGVKRIEDEEIDGE